MSSLPTHATVLFVDDVNEIVDELVTMLSLRSIPAVGAHSLSSALSALQSNSEIRLIVSDVRLHGEAGEDIIKLVSQNEQLASRNLKFLFLTGDVMRFELGATIEGHPILLKPVRPSELIATIFKLLGLSETAMSGDVPHSR